MAYVAPDTIYANDVRQALVALAPPELLRTLATGDADAMLERGIRGLFGAADRALPSRIDLLIERIGT